METPEINDLTPDQRKQISKILSQARLKIAWISLKFGVGLFLANLTTIVIGKFVLVDTDPEMQIGFNLVSIVLNIIFMTRFLDGQIKAVSAKMDLQVAEVLIKKEVEEESVDEK